MKEDILLLIRGCLEGKTSSWDSFVKVFGSVAQNIVRKFRILDPSDHENIVQNVFIKLLRGGLENFQANFTRMSSFSTNKL